MANNIPALKAELLAFFQNTENLDVATKTSLRDGYATVHPQLFLAFRSAEGLPDNANARAKFAIEMTFREWKQTVETASGIVINQTPRGTIS